MGHLLGLQTNCKLTIIDNLKIKEHMPRFSHEGKYFTSILSSNTISEL